VEDFPLKYLLISSSGLANVTVCNTSTLKWNEDNALYSFICSWISPLVGLT